MEEVSAEQLAQDMAEHRAREERRQREREDRERRLEEERLREERRQREERQHRLDEEVRRRRQEEELKRLGSDIIEPLPPVPPSLVDDKDPHALKAWYIDDETSRPVFRCASLKPGRKKGAPAVRLSQLRDIGVVYFHINLNDFGIVNRIVKERLYKHTDELRVSQTCKDEQFLEKWFLEHYNEDEHIRLVTDGSCYFDVRSKQDTWIRLQMQAGDLIVLAPGLYHRGTLDEDDYCAVLRVFRDAQRWAPLWRHDSRSDTHSARLAYLKMLKRGSVAAELGFK